MSQKTVTWVKRQSHDSHMTVTWVKRQSHDSHMTWYAPADWPRHCVPLHTQQRTLQCHQKWAAEQRTPHKITDMYLHCVSHSKWKRKMYHPFAYKATTKWETRQQHVQLLYANCEPTPSRERERCTIHLRTKPPLNGKLDSNMYNCCMQILSLLQAGKTRGWLWAYSKQGRQEVDCETHSSEGR